MREASGWEGSPVVEEIIQALGDDVAAESFAWWQYVFAVSGLGNDGARQLVRDVHAVEAAGGMTTQDGSRRRTPGGVFFVLAYERLGSRRAKSVRWHAIRRVQEAMLQRFLRLLVLVAPPTAEGLAASPWTAPTDRAPGPTRPKHAPAPRGHAAKIPPAKTAPAQLASAKPARRREPEPVEVLVVRRRPAGP